MSFAGKFFTMMSSKKKGGRYTESKKENWRHEKLSTKIQTKPLKNPYNNGCISEHETQPFSPFPKYMLLDGKQEIRYYSL